LVRNRHGFSSTEIRNAADWPYGRLDIGRVVGKLRASADHFLREEREVTKKDYRRPTFVRREKLSAVTAEPPPSGVEAT
jgi:hypothetical protein